MSSEGELEADQLSILVGDIANYTDMSPEAQREFFRGVFPDIAEMTDVDGMIERNSWGDGIIVFFRAPKAAADVALELRDYFRDKQWSNELLPDLEMRLALHNAPVWRGYNPIRDSGGVVGRGVNLAARIESVVVPNRIFVTDSFRAGLGQQLTSDTITFDDMEERELAKGWGKEQLYDMRRPTDKPPKVEQRLEEFSDQPTGDETEMLISFLDSPEPDQQKRAAHLLSQQGNPRAIEPMADALLEESNLAEVRRTIAQGLREFEDERVVEPLIEAIETATDDGVRRKAIFSLGKISYRDGLETLEGILSDSSEPDAVRAAATEALSNIDDGAALDPIVELLERDEDISARLRKVLPLSLAAFDDERVADSLITLLNDPNAEIRKRSMSALANMEESGAVAPLCDVLEAEGEYDGAMRAGAAEALKLIGSPRALDALAAGLEQEDKSVVHHCVQAIGELGDADPSQSAQLLTEIVRDGNSPIDVRAQAAHSMGNLESYDAISLLDEVVRDEDVPDVVRTGAINGLKELSYSDANGPLVAAVDDSSYAVRKSAVDGLSDVGDPAAIDELRTIIENPDESRAELRELAVHSLYETRAMGAVDTLVDAIDDPAEPVQRAAVKRVAQLKTGEGFDTLVAVIQDDSYPASVRGTAAQWIGEYEQIRAEDDLVGYVSSCDNPRVTANLIANMGLHGVAPAREEIKNRLAEGNYPQVRRTAILSLALLGGPQAEEVITEFVTDSSNDVDVRVAAAKSLRVLNTDSANGKLRNIANSGDLPEEVVRKASTTLGRRPSDEKEAIQDVLEDFLNLGTDDEDDSDGS